MVMALSTIITADLSPDNHMVFGQMESDIYKCQAISSELYGSIVEHMPICCVDIFIYNPLTKHYLLVLRKQRPAVNCYFIPGGRLQKGESFFQCAARKCREELGIQVTPHTLLGVYSTVFPDSEWSCPTHTINCAVLAITQDCAIQLDANHARYKWLPLTEMPDNDYLISVHHQAQRVITTQLQD